MINEAKLKSIRNLALTDDQFEQLSSALENTDRGDDKEFDVLVRDLFVDDEGNYYYPCNFKFESQVEEVHGFPTEIGGYYATDYCKLELSS